MNLENQNLKKTKKTLEDIISQMCTINDSHMMYVSWDIECNRQKFLTFWTVFSPFIPPKNQKNQNFEKMTKKPWDIIILHMCNNHMIYGSWDIKHNGHNFLSFWTFFCPFAPLTTPKNENFEKMKKSTWRYYHFTYMYDKWQSYDIWFLRYEVWQT